MRSNCQAKSVQLSIRNRVLERTYLGLLCRWEGRYVCGGHDKGKKKDLASCGTLVGAQLISVRSAKQVASHRDFAQLKSTNPLL